MFSLVLYSPLLKSNKSENLDKLFMNRSSGSNFTSTRLVVVEVVVVVLVLVVAVVKVYMYKWQFMSSGLNAKVS